MWVRSLDQKDPLEEGMATHSSILAWRIPWTEEPRGLQSIGCKTLTQQKWLSTSTRANNQEKEIRYLSQKRRGKILFSDCILHFENPKHSKKIITKNSVKLRSIKSMYRNQVHFYTQITNYQKKKLSNTFTIASNQIPRNKFYQGEIYILETVTDERTWRRHKWMETYSVLTD